MNKALNKYFDELDLELYLKVVENGILECIENILLSNQYLKLYAFSVTFDVGNGYVYFYLAAEKADDSNIVQNVQIYEECTSAEQYLDFLHSNGWENIGEKYASNFTRHYYQELELGERLISVAMKLIDNEAYEETVLFDNALADSLTQKLIDLYDEGAFNALPLAGKFDVILFRKKSTDNDQLNRIRKYGHNFGFSMTPTDFFLSTYSTNNKKL